MLQEQKNKLLFVTLFMWAILIYPPQCYPFATESHRIINENAVSGSQTLDPYLTDVLRFELGLDMQLKNSRGVQRRIVDWLREGGAAEDRRFFDNSFGELLGGLTRSRRHFHQPLRPWDQAGLWGSNESSVRWAQNPNQSVGRKASWFDGRDTYINALLAPTQQDRDANFAETFRFSIDEDGIWRIRNF